MGTTQKIECEMQRIISIIIQRELKDESVKLVTITGIKLLSDLSKATVYYTVMGQIAKKEAVNRSLNNAKGFIKSSMAKKMNIRRIPDLVFEFDKALEYGNKIDEILNNLKK